MRKREKNHGGGKAGLGHEANQNLGTGWLGNAALRFHGDGKGFSGNAGRQRRQ